MEITKKDVVNLVKAKTDLSVKTTSEVVDALLEVITEALADGDSVRFTGFGTFSVTERAARTGKNPRTGEVIAIIVTLIALLYLLFNIKGWLKKVVNNIN